MAPALLRAFGAILIILGALLFMAVTTAHAQFSCPTGFANFGDSLTDTGNNPDAFPFLDGVPFVIDPENPPYGETFFGKPAKRYSNGRIVPDFFSQAFRIPLLDGYFSVASFNYKYGINFASGGANAAPAAGALSPFSVVPFQTNQFIRFKNSVNSTTSQGFGGGCFNFNLNLPQSTFFNPDPLSTWLYTITAGGNDILLPFEQALATNAPLIPLVTTIQQTIVVEAVSAIIAAITYLYATGARQFLIFGLPAYGCTPVVLTYLRNTAGLPTDAMGCNILANNIIMEFNGLLLADIINIRTVLPGANIAFFDYYDAHIEILTHPATYGEDNRASAVVALILAFLFTFAYKGFDPALTKIACCGAPGAGNYNFNPNVICGHPALGSNNCANPDNYVSWDGVHFTENFYRTIAKFALNAQFTTGGVNYTALCNLDFSKFGSGVTFQQAYPFQICNNLFT